MEILDLGTAGYTGVLEKQIDLLNKRIAGEVPDTLIMVEHHPVVTLGRLGAESNAFDAEYFEKQNIPVVPSRRGGEITCHAPGQLVMYPVVDLKNRKKDVSFYIDFLERTVSASLNKIGVPAEHTPEERGVWVHEKKIAFIGIALKQWVTYHGISVNLNNDLDPFTRMDPCGRKGTRVTSAKECLAREVNMRETKKVFAEQFARDLEKAYGGIKLEEIWT
ncbi:MAG: lipoyl(octanoyl) transferase LipB [Candidatus Omnitrophica bacterium]|nr:lipoyl(octanoyl) transferase LipB [Candidatus Omnitrophota bacterium]